MSFLELLKIEFMKVKRSKIVPLIFIAPLLVVASGIANLSSYFTPEYMRGLRCLFKALWFTLTICFRSA